MIGRLKKVPLREVWAHEARDFTSWLADNLDYLEDVLGFPLNLVAQESPVGPFSADILAEDPAGNLVVIENQLAATDHDHLGKILTYMSNLEAKTALWIVARVRPEHERTVQWLNEFLPAGVSLYLIQVEAVRIGDSPPAPLFTIVAGPSEETRAIGGQKKELAERHKRRREFWASLLEKARKRTRLHANRSPTTDHWISTGAGKSGLKWTYVILKDHARVELYIDTPDQAANKAIFDHLHHHREAIEQAFGAPLEWQRLDFRRASRIAYTLRGKGGLQDRDRWDELQEAMIDAMIRMEKAFRPYLKSLP